MHTSGWVHEVLAVVDCLEVVVAVVDECLVGCPLVTMNYRAGQHDTLNDWNQRHCPAIRDELHVADTRCCRRVHNAKYPHPLSGAQGIDGKIG